MEASVRQYACHAIHDRFDAVPRWGKTARCIICIFGWWGDNKNQHLFTDENSPKEKQLLFPGAEQHLTHGEFQCL